MWLINTATLALHEFVPEKKPPYAILSHRWEAAEQEVSFKDFKKGRCKDTKGYAKIEKFCQLLREHNIKWVWVDTCCIDKRSSAELSEAINSMYSYYKSAIACYVYLRDASCEQDDWFRSEWWLRGWTLQELIAPDTVYFYDRDWKYINSKYGAEEAISQHTRVPGDVLSGRRPRDLTAAQIMSWASCRHTTRIEDMAYCMLRLFNVNMPLLYGEGSHAFMRLQLEILQKDADESLLAWDSAYSHSGKVLASMPAAFQNCFDMVPIPDWLDHLMKRNKPRNYRTSPARATPWGIEITADATKLYPKDARHNEATHLVAMTLTTSRYAVQDLPCTLLLQSSLNVPGQYYRLDLMREPSNDRWELLKERYRVERPKEMKLYLLFDPRL